MKFLIHKPDARVQCDQPIADLLSVKQREDGHYWLTFEINKVPGDLDCRIAKDLNPITVLSVCKEAQAFAEIQFWSDNENFHPLPIEEEEWDLMMAQQEFWNNNSTWPGGLDEIEYDRQYQHAVYP